jgi:SH3-like domain-containing protein
VSPARHRQAARRFGFSSHQFTPLHSTECLMNHFHSPSKRAGAMALAALGALAAGGFPPSAIAQAAPQVQACRVNVYASDPDTKGLNVRKGPGPEHAVLASISDSDARFDVTGASGKWLRIRQAAGPDGTVYFRGEGWVFASLTAVRAIKAQGLNAGPGKGSATAGRIAADEEGKVQSCEGEWLQVRVKNTTGWLAPGNHCANPVSGCV